MCSRIIIKFVFIPIEGKHGTTHTPYQPLG
jgi:hypothetical protein